MLTALLAAGGFGAPRGGAGGRGAPRGGGRGRGAPRGRGGPRGGGPKKGVKGGSKVIIVGSTSRLSMGGLRWIQVLIPLARNLTVTPAFSLPVVVRKICSSLAT